MSRARSDKPMIVLKKEARGPVPATAYDAEEWDRLPIGTTVKVEPINVHGRDQLAAYWVTLGKVAEATDRWPSSKHLHEALKFDLGYVRPAFDMFGRPRLVVDSIALDEMSDGERSNYIERAFVLIAETTGIDVADLKREAA